jgi:hypothetical protein
MQIKIMPTNVMGRPCFGICNGKGWFSCAYTTPDRAEAAMIRVFKGNDDNTVHPMNMARPAPEWILNI